MAGRDFILELDGVEGESKEEKGMIDISSWNWGVENDGSWHNAGGGGVGKSHVHDLTFSKVIDKSSPNLFLYCCNGTHISQAVLKCKKAGGEPLDYLTITMKRCMVTSVHTGGQDGSNGQLTETVSLNFAEFDVSYVPQGDTGAGEGSVDVGYNIEENKVK